MSSQSKRYYYKEYDSSEVNVKARVLTGVGSTKIEFYIHTGDNPDPIIRKLKLLGSHQNMDPGIYI